jgi:hypothetical protein
MIAREQDGYLQPKRKFYAKTGSMMRATSRFCRKSCGIILSQHGGDGAVMGNTRCSLASVVVFSQLLFILGNKMALVLQRKHPT